MPTLTVSVALCTYNGARFVERQLDSILAQTVLPDEIVVSDDGSIDDTVALVDESLTAARVLGVAATRVDGRRVGVTGNFARAIAACSSEIVVLSDQDDVWHPDRVATLRTAFVADPSLLLRHEDARLVDVDGEPLGIGLYEALGVTTQDRAAITAGDGFPLYLRRNLATGATVSFRRSLYATAAPLPTEWVHDEWLAIIAAATGRVDASPDRTVDYRQHGANVIGVKKPTLSYRIGRMLATSPDRNRTLAVRASVLATRLGDLPGVSAPDLAAARAKAVFEGERARLPSARVLRLPTIWRAGRAAGYARFASQRRLDILRDLLQRG